MREYAERNEYSYNEPLADTPARAREIFSGLGPGAQELLGPAAVMSCIDTGDAAERAAWAACLLAEARPFEGFLMARALRRYIEEKKGTDHV